MRKDDVQRTLTSKRKFRNMAQMFLNEDETLNGSQPSDMGGEGTDEDLSLIHI